MLHRSQENLQHPDALNMLTNAVTVIGRWNTTQILTNCHQFYTHILIGVPTCLLHSDSAWRAVSIQPHPERLERSKLHNPLFALVILKFTVLHISVFCLPNLLSMQSKMGIKICLTGWDTCLHREVNQLYAMMWRDVICSIVH